jgi:subtilisin family serine protease
VFPDAGRCLALWIVAASAAACASAQAPRAVDYPIDPPMAPYQSVDPPLLETQLEEVRQFIRVQEAMTRHAVDGTGMTAAVIDTGIYTAHVDFQGRIAAQVNLTPDNGGDRANANDGHGHGTNVAGIIAAGGLHTGIAPKARLVAIKVFDDKARGSFQTVLDALRWVDREGIAAYGISVVNVSITAQSTDTSDARWARDELRNAVAALRRKNVAVVVAAGNHYKRYGRGMAMPAIFRETISVGSVYDADGGMLTYPNGAVANSRKAGQLSPFSQRLPESVGGPARTDILAPGSPVTATGVADPSTGSSTQDGTSQAAPVTAGVVLLMQQLYRKKYAGQLPAVDDIERWLRTGSVEEVDGDNEDDNVTHTGAKYPRLDALGALDAVARDIGPIS